MSLRDIDGIKPAVNSLYPMPRPVIGCAASAAAYIALIRSSDRCAMPRTFLEQVAKCSAVMARFAFGTVSTSSKCQTGNRFEKRGAAWKGDAREEQSPGDREHVARPLAPRLGEAVERLHHLVGADLADDRIDIAIGEIAAEKDAMSVPVGRPVLPPLGGKLGALRARDLARLLGGEAVQIRPA